MARAKNQKPRDKGLGVAEAHEAINGYIGDRQRTSGGGDGGGRRYWQVIGQAGGKGRKGKRTE